jgi:predicted acetyltransferase
VLKLIAPTIKVQAAWLASRDDWGRGVHQDGSGLRPTDDVDTHEGFAAWVARLRRMGDEALPPPEGWVHARFWWIIDEPDTVLGAISLRYALNESLLQVGGHIGFGVRPSARGRGVASWALGEVLGAARRRGLDSVLLTCDATNGPSARVIEKHGGVLEDVRDTPHGPVRRYWTAL